MNQSNLPRITFSKSLISIDTVLYELTVIEDERYQCALELNLRYYKEYLTKDKLAKDKLILEMLKVLPPKLHNWLNNSKSILFE